MILDTYIEYNRKGQLIIQSESRKNGINPIMIKYSIDNNVVSAIYDSDSEHLSNVREIIGIIDRENIKRIVVESNDWYDSIDVN